MTIEEKVAEKIWIVATGTKPSNMTDNDRKLYELYAKDILALCQIEVECPECGGEGGFQFSVNPDDCKLCPTCNGNKKIIKPLRVGRII